ncbi:hypothetical protein QQS21_009685 [Conoideocrella luteorostrata]|uniref:Secretory lipase n=1 Tax=Conoideocrella luteorostrata TaxID=1105319 RepID=A0AAJ0FXK6_9HYPO|nr:hypothetical protein QQS21_009685 [Conoideocrella luteorostrata]
MLNLKCLLSCALFAYTQTASAAPDFSALAAPALPGADPFYQPPAGFESKQPGTILRNRPVPNPLVGFLGAPIKVASAHQILYRTTDTFGKAIVTVSTVLIPKNANPSRLLSYQVAEDAANPNCAPSYVFQQGSQTGGFLGTVVTQIEANVINDALDNGWYVTVPDFLGPKSAFLANVLAGQAVLDGIRATLASSSFTKLAANPIVNMWGYSGGSLASGFAAELQPSYAPELKIAGVVLGGTCPDILSVMFTINKTFFAALIATGILGLAEEYPEIASLVADQVIPEKAQAVLDVKSKCLAAAVLAFSGQDIFSYVKDPTIFNGTVAKTVTDANGMGHAAPKIPVLIYKATNDEVSPVADTDKVVDFYCKGGSSVDYRRTGSTSGHIGMLFNGKAAALAWLKDRFNGVPAKQGCTTSTKL